MNRCDSSRSPRLASFLTLASLVASQVSAAPLADGPYVMHQPNGAGIARWVEHDDSNVRVREERTAVGQQLTIPAVGSLPAFTVRLREPDPIVRDEATLTPAAPFFVVADTHGEYQIVVELLRQHRIVDSALRWSFGNGHLIFLGDVFDRGVNQTEVLWLIYELEAQATRAGGGVHLVLGNHEVMVLTGDLRYLHPKYVQTGKALGVESYAELFDRSTLLGQWLRTKPAVLKLNGLLFLHGGISPAIVERNLTIPTINAVVRKALNSTSPGETDQTMELVMGWLGPLWYRGYFADQKDFPTATSADIESIRMHLGVSAILVGHTIVPTVTPLYDGRVIAVQVYPRREESGQVRMEGVRVEKGRFLRAKIDGSLEPLGSTSNDEAH